MQHPHGQRLDHTASLQVPCEGWWACDHLVCAVARREHRSRASLSKSQPVWMRPRLQTVWRQSCFVVRHFDLTSMKLHAYQPLQPLAAPSVTT